MAEPETLRARIAAALDASIDRCARCKTCDAQVDAVMAVLEAEGVETEWGISYPVGHPEERVRNFGSTDGELAARLLLPDTLRAYRGKAKLVYREIGPWKSAEDGNRD